MKDRGLKTREPFSSTINIELLKQFNELSEKTMINKSKLLDLAIKDLIAKFNQQ